MQSGCLYAPQERNQPVEEIDEGSNHELKNGYLNRCNLPTMRTDLDIGLFSYYFKQLDFIDILSAFYHSGRE